jgi:site-specific recombinase XerD
MSSLAPSPFVPPRASLYAPTPQAAQRVLEFFTAHINNPHTRKAYKNAAQNFAAWCAQHELLHLSQVQPFHVAAFLQSLQGQYSAPTVKQHLAALRMLFDYLVTGQVIPTNPAHAVRGPKHVVKKGKTPVLTPEETRTLLDSIDVSTLAGLRDRALIGVMVYTFARINAVVNLRREDYFQQGRRGWLRLREKGGKEHDVPCHHNLERYLDEFLARAGQGNGYLFTSLRQAGKPLTQQDVYRMVQKRAQAAGIATRIGNHTFRATGITAYLKNGGKLEIAQQIAGHESPRTTKLYDRREDQLTLDEIARIAI